MSDLLPIGTKVKINDEGFRKYREGDANPRDVLGEVCEHHDWGFPMVVKWDNGRTNSYEAGTLDAVAATPTFKVGDMVRAKDDAPYVITTAGWEGYVRRTHDAFIVVSAEMDSPVWDMYQVETEYFDLVEDAYDLTTALPATSMHQPVELLPDMPIDAPTKWADMDAEQKGALLLAHHNGEEIQLYASIEGHWVECDVPEFLGGCAYRVVTPEMKKAEELKELRSRIAELEDELSPPKPVLAFTKVRTEPARDWF